MDAWGDETILLMLSLSKHGGRHQKRPSREILAVFFALGVVGRHETPSSLDCVRDEGAGLKVRAKQKQSLQPHPERPTGSS